MKSFYLQVSLLTAAYIGLIIVACSGAAAAGSRAGDDAERARLRSENVRLHAEMEQRLGDERRVLGELLRVEKLNRSLAARVKALEAEKAQTGARPTNPFGWTPPQGGTGQIGAEPPK